VIVVKVGGAVVGDELGALEDAVVVHGGGKQITAPPTLTTITSCTPR